MEYSDGDAIDMVVIPSRKETFFPLKGSWSRDLFAGKNGLCMFGG